MLAVSAIIYLLLYAYVYYPATLLHRAVESLLNWTYANIKIGWIYKTPFLLYPVFRYGTSTLFLVFLFGNRHKLNKRLTDITRSITRWDGPISEALFLGIILILFLGYGIFYQADFDGGEVIIPTIAKGLLSFWEYPRSVTAILAEYYTEEEDREVLSPYINWGPVVPYLVAISFKLFGISEFSARLPSLLFGFGTVLLSYLLSKKIMRGYGHYWTALLLCTSPLLLRYANNASYDIPMGFFLIASTYCITCYLKTNKKRYLELSGLMLGIGIWIKYTIILAIAPSALFLKNKKNIIRFIGVFFILVTALGAYFISIVGIKPTANMVLSQAMRYFSNDGVFYTQSNGEILSYLFRFEYPLIILSTLGFAYFAKSRKRYERYLAYLTLFLFVALLFSSTKTLRHFVIILPLFAIVATAGVTYLVRKKLRVFALLLLAIQVQVFVSSGSFVFYSDAQYSQISHLFDKQYKILGCETPSIGYYADMEYYFSGSIRAGEFFKILSTDKKVRYIVLCDYKNTFPRLELKEAERIEIYVRKTCRQIKSEKIANGLFIFDCG